MHRVFRSITCKTWEGLLLSAQQSIDFSHAYPLFSRLSFLLCIRHRGVALTQQPLPSAFPHAISVVLITSSALYSVRTSCFLIWKVKMPWHSYSPSNIGGAKATGGKTAGISTQIKAVIMCYGCIITQYYILVSEKKKYIAPKNVLVQYWFY